MSKDGSNRTGQHRKCPGQFFWGPIFFSSKNASNGLKSWHKLWTNIFTPKKKFFRPPPPIFRLFPAFFGFFCQKFGILTFWHKWRKNGPNGLKLANKLAKNIFCPKKNFFFAPRPKFFALSAFSIFSDFFFIFFRFLDFFQKNAWYSRNGLNLRYFAGKYVFFPKK